MYALVEMGSTDDFRRKHLNISFTAMAFAIAVKEVLCATYRQVCNFHFKKARISLISAKCIEKFGELSIEKWTELLYN